MIDPDKTALLIIGQMLRFSIAQGADHGIRTAVLLKRLGKLAEMEYHALNLKERRNRRRVIYMNIDRIR